MNKETSSLIRLLQETHNLVAFHHECELNYPLSIAIKSFLAPNSSPKKHSSFSLVTAPAKHNEKKVDESAGVQTLEDLKNSIGSCSLCLENEEQHSMIFGEGSTHRGTNLFIILDPPGVEEEKADSPITGPPRELLIKMLAAIKLSLDEVFLTNIIKCATPMKHPANKEATSACLPFLVRQIELLAPKIICTMGQVATQTVLKSPQSLFGLRGTIYNFHGVPVVPTFHPVQLLKTPDLKKGAWHDLQKILQKIKS